MRPDQRGSATVEVAMCVPMLVLFMLLMVQVAVVMLDQLAVTQAAREGARAAVVNPSPGVAAAAAGRATRLHGDRLTVAGGRVADRDGMIRVTVSYRGEVKMPLTNRVLMHPVLTSSAAMRAEQG